MTAREIIAYAITHAPPGVKGGPYEAIGGDMGDTCARLSASLRWPVDNPVNTPEEVLAEAREFLAEEIAPKVPHARVIRIVRKARPSEASAVEVLREYVAWDCGTAADYDRIADKARRVLAGSGPDPMPVVRAAMRRRYERKAYLDQARAGRGGTTRLWEAAEDAEDAAVDAYRKAGGK